MSCVRCRFEYVGRSSLKRSVKTQLMIAAISALTVATLACGGDATGVDNSPKSIALAPASPAILRAGGTLQLAASVKDGAGNTLSSQSVSFLTSAGAIATVNYRN